MLGRVLDCLSRFRRIVACCKILSHNLRLKSLYNLHSPAIKWFLNVCIDLYALFSLWLLVGTNWYLMFMVFIVIFMSVHASLSMNWEPGLIPRIFKSSVKDVKDLIISVSLIFFIAVVRMTVIHIHYIYVCVTPA